MTPEVRVLAQNDRPVQPAAEYVLYWMTSGRRLGWNYALQRAVEEANRLKKTLLVFEPLRCGYKWASDRHHLFVIQGMRDNQETTSNQGISYYPYVEPSAGAASGLLRALATRAALVVTDHFPCFFLPAMVRAAGANLMVRLEAVDNNGLYPIRDAQRDFTTAASFRRHLQKRLPLFLDDFPLASPLSTLENNAPVDLADVPRRWPAARLSALVASEGLAQLPIDHHVKPVALKGGSQQAA